jgi:hypothetical protein
MSPYHGWLLSGTRSQDASRTGQTVLPRANSLPPTHTAILCPAAPLPLNVHRIRRCPHQPASRDRQRPHRPPLSPLASLLRSLLFPLSLRAREPSRPDSLARTTQNAFSPHSASPAPLSGSRVDPPWGVLKISISLSNPTASGGRSTPGSWPAPSRATSS